MNNNTTFFNAVDLSDELTDLLKSLEKNGIKIIEQVFNELSKSELNPIQELIILEVAIRIINADKKHDENEIKFLNLLRSKLKVHDEIITDRFGKIDILHVNDYSMKVSSTFFESNIGGITLPNLDDLRNISFQKGEKN